MQKIKVKSHSVQKLEWNPINRQANGQTEATALPYLPC